MNPVNMPSMDSVARFKAAMESDRGALGPFMIGTDPAFVEAAGYAGYDFVLLDMEHGTTTHQQLPHLIRAANVAGVCPVVRVPRGTDIWIDQALDVGAGAVMIPQIDTAEQARAAISAAKFSPVGTRGTCRFVRSAGFGAVPGSEYFAKAQDTAVILQAEGRKAVENLDEILDVPGIDVLFVGPYDLSSSLGLVGQAALVALRRKGRCTNIPLTLAAVLHFLPGLPVVRSCIAMRWPDRPGILWKL